MIANVLHALLDESAVGAMWKKIKLVLTLATLVARNANEALVGFGEICVWR
jgi:hypothetical protein